jgi:hypothetical protein
LRGGLLQEFTVGESEESTESEESYKSESVSLAVATARKSDKSDESGASPDFDFLDQRRLSGLLWLSGLGLTDFPDSPGLLGLVTR